ncbi:MAG: hypothetical protein ACOYNB_00820 [Aquabacterium sp.]|uniref:hypothetical protein n=1 Tax=Aquabacterium sp. TaxID=1872578 RepID=UPI003BC39620
MDSLTLTPSVKTSALAARAPRAVDDWLRSAMAAWVLSEAVDEGEADQSSARASDNATALNATH